MSNWFLSVNRSDTASSYIEREEEDSREVMRRPVLVMPISVGSPQTFSLFPDQTRQYEFLLSGFHSEENWGLCLLFYGE